MVLKALVALRESVEAERMRAQDEASHFNYHGEDSAQLAHWWDGYEQGLIWVQTTIKIMEGDIEYKRSEPRRKAAERELEREFSGSPGVHEGHEQTGNDKTR